MRGSMAAGRQGALLLSFAWVLSLGILGGCGGRVNDLNRQALNALQKGKPQQAVNPLQEACRLAPSRPEIRYNLAEAYRRLGRLEEALAEIEQAASLAPNRADIAGAQARLRLATGQAERALADLETLSARVRKQPPVQFYYALACVENGRAAEALPMLEKMLKAKPRSAPIHAALGLAYLRLGRGISAREQLETALKLNGQLFAARLYLAQLHLSSPPNYLAAKEQLYLARQIEPTNPRLHVLLGYAHLGLDNPGEAARSFERSIQLHPSGWEGYLGLAESALKQGDRQRALDYARRAQGNGGVQPAVLNFLGRLYTLRSQTSLAVQMYRESLEQNPDQPDVRLALEKLQSS